MTADRRPRVNTALAPLLKVVVSCFTSISGVLYAAVLLYSHFFVFLLSFPGAEPPLVLKNGLGGFPLE